MSKHTFLLLIDKFLSGKTTDEENNLLEQYYQNARKKSNAWEELPLHEKEAVEIRIRQRLNKSIHKEELPAARFTQAIPLKRIISIAAVFILIIGSGYLFRNEIETYLWPAHQINVVTANSERKIVHLPDGSIVWIEPGSSFKYPDKFASATREVELTGEAFFEVAKNKDKPFLIHTNKITTKVLGTSFNVKAYDSTLAKVVVVTGRVEVNINGNRDEDKVVLTPNQSATYVAKTNTLLQTKINNTAFFSERQNGHFVYRGESVENVVSDIEKNYNVTILLKGNIKQCTFYGDFNIQQEIEKVLALLGAALNATVEKNAHTNTYTITGKGC